MEPHRGGASAELKIAPVDPKLSAVPGVRERISWTSLRQAGIKRYDARHIHR